MKNVSSQSGGGGNFIAVPSNSCLLINSIPVAAVNALANLRYSKMECMFATISNQ